MRPEVPKWLEDIRDAATYILSATKGKTMEAFATDRTLRQAVERSFEVIGEAMNRISRVDPPTAEKLSGRQQIIGFRNVLIHGYDHIDVEIIWRIIQNRLPKLLHEVEELLRSA